MLGRILGAMLVLGLGAGCLQLTGVADYKVEEACTIPAGQSCRVAPNCGCDGNKTCLLARPDGTGECAEAGAVPNGGNCSVNGDCGKGLACLDGRCGKYCASDAQCENRACAKIVVGGTPVNNTGVCGFPCDPINGSACPSGQACRFGDTVGGKKTTGCYANPGTVDEGGPCADRDDDCGPTLFCLERVCRRLCVAGSACASGPCGDALISAHDVSYGICPAGG